MNMFEKRRSRQNLRESAVRSAEEAPQTLSSLAPAQVLWALRRQRRPEPTLLTIAEKLVEPGAQQLK